MSPDLDYVVVNLNEVRFKVVARGGEFPEGQRDYVYAFDTLNQADVERHRRAARQWETLLGDTHMKEGQPVWVVLDPADD